MHAPFFPTLAFAWTYLVVLLGLLIAASCTDLRRMVVPKWLTLTGLGIGLVFNVARGAWLGHQGLPTWLLGGGSTGLGTLDGALFSAAGFLLGFVLFFGMWVLGVCGGGDVKLFAALGAWIGPTLALYVLVVTVPIVFCMMFARLLFSLLSGNWKAVRRTMSPRGPHPRSRAKDGNPQPARRVLGFSLPLAIATALVLLWAFRVDLHFVPEKPASTIEVVSHAS